MGAGRDPERDVMGLMLTTNAAMVAGVLRGGGSDPDAVLRAIAATRSLGMVVEDTLRTLVAQARAAGRTWAEIGRLLQVSRQAAFQRFGATTRAPSGADGEPVPDALAIGLEVLHAFLDGRIDEMRARFDQRMTREAPPALMAGLRDSLRSELGSVDELGAGTVSTRGPYTVIDVPLSFAGGERIARVVLDDDRRVAGFFML